MLKFGLCTGAKLNFRDRVCGEVENSIIALQAKRGTVGSCHQEDLVRSLMVIGSRVGLLRSGCVCIMPEFLQSDLR